MVEQQGTLRLTAGAVRRLADEKRIDPGPGSPLALLLGQGAVADAAAPPGFEDFADAVAVLERPTALVRLLATVPDKGQRSAPVLVRDGLTATFSLEDGAIVLAHAQTLDAFAESLPANLSYEGPLAGQGATVWPSALAVLTALWKDKLDTSVRLPRRDVLARLGGEADPRAAEGMLRDIVATGAVVDDGEAVTLDERLAPWLGLLWSGHVAQLEYVALGEETTLEEALDAAGETLMFVGPPGQRVRNEVLTGAALREQYRAGEPPEERLIQLSALSREAVEAEVRRLLRLPLVAAAA
ncbi:MAG TPA: hypothetical protein VII13_06600 [Vicinamibacteria bacterium]|jgi:hypothetical protein